MLKNFIKNDLSCILRQFSALKNIKKFTRENFGSTWRVLFFSVMPYVQFERDLLPKNNEVIFENLFMLFNAFEG